MKKYKELVFIVAVVSCCLFVFLFNYFLDPYDIKQYSRHNFDIMNAPRSMISTFLKQSKDVKYKNVVLGACSAHNLFLTDMFLCKTNEPIARLLVPGFSSDKVYDLLLYFLDMHPEVENVYFELENYTYLLCNNQIDFKIEKTTSLQDFINLYFSVDASRLSLNKFIQLYLKKDKQNNQHFENDDSFLVYPKKKYVMECNENCYDNNIANLKKIKELLDSRNINTTYFIPPTHALYLGDLYFSGKLDIYKKLKKSYSQVIDFIDMAFINDLTLQPFDWMWQDVMKLSSFLNMDIYEVLVDKKKSDIAMLVTSENVDKVLHQQEKLIKSFVEQNLEMVQEYSNFEHDEGRQDLSAKKNYYKDIPEKYNIRNFCPMEKVISIEKSLGL